MSGEKREITEPVHGLGSDLPIGTLSTKSSRNTFAEQDVPASSEQADNSGSDQPIDTPSTDSDKKEGTEQVYEIAGTLPIITRTEPVGNRARDEYEVDFEDPKNFVLTRWEDILAVINEGLTEEERKIASVCVDFEGIRGEIHGRLTDESSSAIERKHLNRVLPLPRTLNSLTRRFVSLVEPLEPKLDIIWGLIYLSLKASFSYTSPDRLKRTADLLNKVRAAVLLFNSCLATCEQVNESLIAIADFLDPLTVILLDSINFLKEYPIDADAKQAWPDHYDTINESFKELDEIVKHVNDITSYSKANQDRQIKNLSLKHALTPEGDEPGAFPNINLPYGQNSRFYGRGDELQRIEEYLRPKDDDNPLRTYTIYGRRGVGKTEIALQFAHTNHVGFDAIFWIQCETTVSIRQSFTEVAASLNLPGADRDGHHEENQLAVQKWLKKTSKRWLLIFDNAEQDYILKGYWPIGAPGAILTTSRKYHNFTKDSKRKGETIKPFDKSQSWDLLLQLLGDEYKKRDREGSLPSSEVAAAKGMLEKLGGLALAIRQAASLIKNADIGGPTIVKTYEIFREKIKTLPERHMSDRSSTELPLDALWDMTFNSLKKNTRVLLGVLAWLSPDSIPRSLFTPRQQSALDGRLAFCKQETVYIDEKNRASLFSVTSPTPGLEAAVDELLAKQLIKKDRQNFSIHRVVQEAVNYHDVADLQQSFDVASRLVYEQFPLQVEFQSLYARWSACQEFIPHGVILSKKFSDYTKGGKLKANDWFLELLRSCAWYLHEIADFDGSGRVVSTAIQASEDKTTVRYTRLTSIAADRLFDLNKLSECRKAWETSLAVVKQLPEKDQSFAAGILNNLGNLETACGNVKDAQEYFESATSIYRAGGDRTAFNLAQTYLSMGRMQMFSRQFGDAEKKIDAAEQLFARIGSPSLSMAHVHFTYGNCKFMQKRYEIAQRSYEDSLKIAVVELPIHPITAAVYYSLAGIELVLDHPEVAMQHLNKARQIAEIRSPTRDDGVIARILWRTAVVLESDVLGKFKSGEANELRQRAELARKTLAANGEGGFVLFGDQKEEGKNTEQDEFDALVPLFYR